MSYFSTSRIVYGALVVAAIAFGHATFTGWAVALVAGGFLALLQVFARRMAVAHVAADAARELLRDDPDAAEAVVRRARDAKVPLAAAPLYVATVDAEIALLRGRIDDVRAIVDEALRRPRDRFDPVSDGTARRELTAVGAIARATADDADGALRAADAIDADDASSLRALARAAIARAIVLARSGRREELGALLRDRRTMLDLGASARERGLARAFARLARVPASSVYRRNATSVTKTEGGWASAAAGDAAGLLEQRGPSAEPIAAKAEEARRLPDAAPKTGRWRLVVLWAVLVAMALAAFQLLPSRGALGRPAPPDGALLTTGHLDVIAAVAILACGLLLFRRVRAGLHAWDDATRLTTRYARGEEAEAKAALERMTKGSNAVLSAQASLTLATLANLRGEPAAARVEAERGLGRLKQTELRLATADMLYPELIAQWAYALAGEGDAKAARGAIASMSDYARAVRSRYRVELLARWREGDEAGAADWAERGERDLATGAEDDLLSDAIRAAVRGDALAGGELSRIVDEVGDAHWRRFLDGVAPGLAARVAARSTDRIADADVLPEIEREAHEAEREAAAEEEITQLGFGGARA